MIQKRTRCSDVILQLIDFKWWPGTELNRRRQPFQGCALPPELPGHLATAGLPNFSLESLFDPDGTEWLWASTLGSVVEQPDYNNHAAFPQCDLLAHLGFDKATQPPHSARQLTR
jgi:hypothetical protein